MAVWSAPSISALRVCLVELLFAKHSIDERKRKNCLAATASLEEIYRSEKLIKLRVKSGLKHWKIKRYIRRCSRDEVRVDPSIRAKDVMTKWNLHNCQHQQNLNSLRLHGTLNFSHFSLNDFLYCFARTRKLYSGPSKPNLNQHLARVECWHWVVAFIAKSSNTFASIYTYKLGLKNDCHLCAFGSIVETVRRKFMHIS